MKISVLIRTRMDSGFSSKTMRLHLALTTHNIQAVDRPCDLKKVERMMRYLNV